jgi:magnesium chelatase subunit D
LEEAFALAEAMARDKRVQYIVVDTEEPGAVSFGLARTLAERLKADYLKTEGLKAKTLVELVRSQTGP